jgi:CRISPR-associated protein Cas1
MMKDLQLLPRLEDSLTFLYVEKVRIEQAAHAIVLLDAQGDVPVPVASLSVLILGPGSTITHAAVLALADNGCSVVWAGESGARFYASGLGETHRAANIMAQAKAWADKDEHLEVVKRLYRMRFDDLPSETLTLEQLRGMEGVRVRETYAALAKETGVRWHGRAYKRDAWDASDPVNRALSTANACLYGLVHAAIVSTGFSPALGFIHTGKALSFVYDIADLYKCAVTIPIAFDTARGDPWMTGFEGRVRRACRSAFWEHALLAKIVPDIQRVLGLRAQNVRAIARVPADGGNPNDVDVGDLWDLEMGTVAGGRNWGARRAPLRSDGGRPGDPMPLEEEDDSGADDDPGQASTG